MHHAIAVTEDAHSRRQGILLTLLSLELLLRLLQLHFAIRSPLTWQMGPDEDFYFRFGQDVAFGRLGLAEEFAFMDPLYGYLIGSVLKLGGGLFPLYLVQIGVDVLTGLGLYRIAAILGRHRAGLLALGLYALTGTAIAYSMAILKAVWVAAFVVWWIYGALRLLSARRATAWAAFGAYCSVGVALRSNLILLVPVGTFVLAWLLWRNGAAPALVWRRMGALLLGLALPLLLLGARNHAISGHWDIAPNNGGIVLHQLYNPENPQSRAGVPRFVERYSTPSEIWQGYRTEAERRLGHALDAHQVDAYWRGIARDYLLAHPRQVLANVWRKFREFSAWPEVPNTRSYGDERIASPLLAWFPPPFGWLFALGVPGLALLLWQDRRGLLVLVPVAVGLFTIVLFFAEDRFRFNIIGPFVLGAGIWLAALWQALAARHWTRLLAMLALSAALGGWSLWQAQALIPTFPSDWQRLAWGYLKSGQRERADALLAEIERSQPAALGLEELRGYLALQEGRHAEAAELYRRAIARRSDRHEVWHNYASALEGLGDHAGAVLAETRALSISPGPEYAYRVAELLELGGRIEEARQVYRRVAGDPVDSPWRERAREKLAMPPLQ